LRCARASQPGARQDLMAGYVAHAVTPGYRARAVAFFFQAEDGIRDFHVTGVQTCALPIYPGTFFINLGDMASNTRWSLPTLAYHEGSPGHHFQISIGQTLTDLPLLRRSLNPRDRKSTRLNSSHVKISYAVLCSEKKTREGR